jgi:lysine 6-dehydrogenase
MKLLVLGAGLQGGAAAWNLLQHRDVEAVTIADHRPSPLPEFLERRRDARLRQIVLDANDLKSLVEAMAKHNAALNALPYYFNEAVTRAAIESGCHACDLGGNTDIVFAQKKLSPEAESRGVSVIPDCGLAPGMVNILAAEGIRRLDRTTSVKVYVGGLPQHPEPPLNYQIVYSLEGALDYYSTPSWVLRGGKTVRVDALSELETLEFPAPVGALEAFHTGGGISTLPFAFEGRIETMEYKTLRYPGHVAIMRPIRELGLISNTPITVKGKEIVPRDVFIAAVEPQLRKPDSPDLVALRVLVSGEKDGREKSIRFELLDFSDEKEGISAMMRTTGFSLALTAMMQANGTISQKGVHTPDEVIPFSEYVAGLGRFGVEIREKREGGSEKGS